MHMNTSLPRFSLAAKKGEQGVQLVSAIVLNEFGWIFKRNHQEHDLGIDGQIEVVTAEGFVTGQFFAVQIKYGKSFFREKNRWGYIYRGEQKHFNYLANYPIPVLILLCHPVSKECYWVRFVLHETQNAGNSWKITIPFENRLRHSKTDIEAMLPPLIDYRKELKIYWALNKVFPEFGCLHFVVDKSEVEAMDTTPTRKCFDRLRVTKEIALENQGKVEISFLGYENDTRALFEIPEVRKFISSLTRDLPELFFFVRTEPPYWTLKTFALCHANDSRIYDKTNQSESKDFFCGIDKVVDFIEQGFAGLNEITEWLSLPLEDNKRISSNILRCFEKDPGVK